MLDKQCYSLFGLVCWTSNVIFYFILYIGLMYKIIFLYINVCQEQKLLIIFSRNIYHHWFITETTADNGSISSGS
jgi:hypothetical protein